VQDASAQDVSNALAAAAVWQAPARERAAVLRRAADLLEKERGALFALLAREAGKTALDAIAELREAVDFLRFYAGEGERHSHHRPRGVVTCISPWNFPLAIYIGQVAAALSVGNAVLAKPAEPTPLVAHYATVLLHQAGVPRSALQFLPGAGAQIGASLVSSPAVKGVCFTGSTQTAQSINRAMADHLHPSTPLIAETGGLNAMIVDSTALPEQAVRDIVASAFQSAGQRCSALRILYVQADVADTITQMLVGAMEQLSIGQPWDFATDVGPLITAQAQRSINTYIARAQRAGQIVHQLKVPSAGFFVRPTLMRVTGINDLAHEVFGPVLHIATFKADELEQVIADINYRGFGLTFGLHSRIDDRVQAVVAQLKAGNLYINRNQIGAVVGSQPFGGEGLSGTGPKAGGPHYVKRFCAENEVVSTAAGPAALISADQVQKAIDEAPACVQTALSTQDMPGPTGESNRLSVYPRGRILCLGPGQDDKSRQQQDVAATRCVPVVVDGQITPQDLASLEGFDGAVYWGGTGQKRALRQALAGREGALLPLITEDSIGDRCVLERHVCVDTTAAGGNTKLMSGAV
jgi:RHH-type proline utilization regulon transcriptional repressor/proline dehydrogenase/delta 1-pyrroline-5-carboxylate dehydrogenase